MTIVSAGSLAKAIGLEWRPARWLPLLLCLGLPVLVPATATEPNTIDAALRHLESRNGMRLTHGGLGISAMMREGDWQQLEELKTFKELKDLSLSAENITDADLVHLKDFVWLESLSIVNTQVCGPGLEHLARLPNLRRLCLIGQSIGDETMSRLRLFPHLTHLYLLSTSVTDAGTDVLRDLIELEELHLSGNRISEDSLPHLKPLQKLRVLQMFFAGEFSIGDVTDWERSRKASSKKITDAGLPHLAVLRNLRSLSLRDTTITTVEPLQQLPHLLELDLMDGSLTSDGLSASVRFPALRKLRLRPGVGKIAEDGLRHVSHAALLEELNLHGTSVTDADLVHLTQLKRLKVLNLSHTGVTDVGMALLKQVRSLESLDLTGTKLGDEGMAALAELPRLRVLIAKWTRISDGCVSSLEKMAALREFNPIENKFTTEARLALEQRRPNLHVWIDAPP